MPGSSCENTPEPTDSLPLGMRFCQTNLDQMPRQQDSSPTRQAMPDRKQIKYLRSLAHALKPVVRLGQHGLTDAVTRELDIALDRHELVKVKLAADDRAARDEQLAALAVSVNAAVVQRIGHTATLYRANPRQPRIDLTAA